MESARTTQREHVAPPAAALERSGRPRLAATVVPRPRITEAILDACRRHRLVEVIAAAGSGKTVAVSQATDALARPVAWLTLERWHADAGKLCADLAASLGAIVPDLDRAIDRTRRGRADPAELAGTIGAAIGGRGATIVLDDCHVVRESPEAIAALSSFVKHRAPDVVVVLVGRVAPPLAGLDVDCRDPAATVGHSVLRATRDEAAEILRRRNATILVDTAIEATCGWVTGLILTAWRTADRTATTPDPLRDYLDREVLRGIPSDAQELLVASSVFDRIDVPRARALGAADPRAWFLDLRSRGVPAEWASDATAMRLPPVVRECLRGELGAGSRERERTVARRAGAALEREGDPEGAIELYRQAESRADVNRLLPGVILGLAEKCDVDGAERWLAEPLPDPEPAEIVLARLIVASIRASGADGYAVAERAERTGRLTELVVELPTIGAFACHFLLWGGRIDAAVALTDAMPPGRARDVARLGLSLARNDPEAPLPPFAHDTLDAAIARLLWSRGRLAELRAGRTEWAERTGALALSDLPAKHPPATEMSAFALTMIRFASAVGLRDLDTARTCVADLVRDGRTLWSLLCEAEIEVRLARNPAGARAAVRRLEAEGAMSLCFLRELADTWRGGALLLDDDAQAAAEVLRGAVASMRDGDRTLILSTALVYLAEAEWRLGHEGASDRLVSDAYAVARRQGSLKGLLLSLGDFPQALSRRIDVEPAVDGAWHGLGRTLARAHERSRRPAPAVATAHLREFGEPALVVGGELVTPKITKSLELLSYLLDAPNALVERPAVLASLWNQRDDDPARAYLRQALRHLRDALPEGITVTSVGDALRVEGAITSESLELEALLAAAAQEVGASRLNLLLEAVEIANRGLFLAGSKGVDWVDKRRLEVRGVMARTRLDAAELLLDIGRHPEALALLEDALETDPLLERGWRLRMTALGLLGDDDAVLFSLRACRAALAEIGLEPSPATLDVARRFRR